MAVTRPVVRYHGGKWLLAPWIIAQMPAHRIYVEPFGGAGSVLLRKPRSYAEVYNDLDGDMVNVFRVLRDPVSAGSLESALRLTPWAREEFIGSYDDTSDPVERARRTIVRGFMAFGTSSRRKNVTGFRAKAYRTGQTGVDDWVNYPEQIRMFVSRLQGVCVENRPAVEVIRQQDDIATLFYVDPPYVQSTRSSIRTASVADRAYAVDMSDEDHGVLATELHRSEGMVLLSGYRCELYDDLYGDWQRLDREVLADGAQRRIESLWFNPAAWDARPQTVMFQDEMVS